MIDRIAYTSVLGNGLICEVNLAVLVNGHVLEKSVAGDGTIDVGLSLLVEVDDLSIAAALEVEHTLVVPSVLVVADELTLRVGRQRGLTGAGETEEDSGVLTVHIGVGRAVHAGDTTQREEVVLHREHTLLHLTTIPSIQDHLLLAGHVEDNGSLRVQAQLFPVGHLSLRCVVNDEIGLLLKVSLCLRTNEHVGHEVSLPCHLHDEANLHAGVAVSAAETVDDIQLLVGELFLSKLLHSLPGLNACAVVVVVILIAVPPHGVVRGSVINDELILRRAAGVDTSHHVDCAQLSLLSLVVALEARLGLLVEENLIRRIVQNLGGTRLDTIGC